MIEHLERAPVFLFHPRPVSLIGRALCLLGIHDIRHVKKRYVGELRCCRRCCFSESWEFAPDMVPALLVMKASYAGDGIIGLEGTDD